MVIQCSKQLVAPPMLTRPFGMHMVHYRGESDALAWLNLREQVFARESPSVRQWDLLDFEREMTSKPWWNPQAMWLAERLPDRVLIGSVTLAVRGSGKQPAIHWLLVHPMVQRRGVGRWLVSHVEQACWNAGCPNLVLETDTGWTSALALYRSMGYVPKNTKR